MSKYIFLSSVWMIGSALAVNCGDFSDETLADMGDGDQKILSVHDNMLTIGQPGIWNLTTPLDSTCSAVIDFQGAGKPNYPPCNLVGKVWQTSIGTIQLEFTDKTGTITKDPTYPLNIWTSLKSEPAANHCASFAASQFQDLHDGDVKTVRVHNGEIKMGQAGIWSLKTSLDGKTCQAMIDFSTTTKPDQPPVPLLAEVFTADGGNVMIVFTDPSATLNKDPSYPLNIWIRV